MNGLEGCLREMSDEFDISDKNDIGKAIRQASRYHDKIVEAEAMKEMQEKERKVEEPINVAELTREIRDDMEK